MDATAKVNITPIDGIHGAYNLVVIFCGIHRPHVVDIHCGWQMAKDLIIAGPSDNHHSFRGPRTNQRRQTIPASL
jgi:hypothetical protein